MASIWAFSSSVRNFSEIFFSHSAGMSAARSGLSIFSRPWNTWLNTRSNLSMFFSSFTRAERDR